MDDIELEEAIALLNRGRPPEGFVQMEDTVKEG